MNKYQEALNDLRKETVFLKGERTIVFKSPKTEKTIDEQCDTLQELIDKETPMLVKIWECAQPATRCPVCSRGVEKYGDDKYCPNCGQRLK